MVSRKACCGCNIALFIIGAILLIGGLLLEFVFMEKIVHSKAKKMVIIGKDDDGSLNQFTDSWLHQNYRIYMQFWYYNYTNAADVITKGVIPQVTEHGPYSYAEKLFYDYNPEKSFSSDGTRFTYTKGTSYFFDIGTSCDGCSESDEFVVPDMVFFGLADKLFTYDGLCVQMYSQMQKLIPILPPFNGTETCLQLDQLLTGLMSVSLQGLIDQFISLAQKATLGPLRSIKVSDYSFDGIDSSGIYTNFLKGPVNDVFYNLIKKLDPNATVDLPAIPHASIRKSRMTITPDYTVNTGKNDYTKTGQMIQYDDHDTLPLGYDNSKDWLNVTWWGDWNCNATYKEKNETISAFSTTTMETVYSDFQCTACSNSSGQYASSLRGTHGDYFHALIEKSEGIPVFQEDICRSVDLYYEKDVTDDDLDGYRYRLSLDTFNTNNNQQCGYCRPIPADMYGLKKGEYCLPNGLLELSGCEPESARVAISNPHWYGADPKVQSFVPLNTPVQENDQTSVDINPTVGTVLRANKRVQINYLVTNYNNTPWNQFRQGAYPVAWVNESYTISNYLHDTIKDQVVIPQKVVKILCYTIGVGIGGLFIVISVLSTIWMFCIGKKKDIITDMNGTTARYDPHDPHASVSDASIPREKRKDF